MWPEFSINDFKIACKDYYQRNRKFGEVTHSKTIILQRKLASDPITSISIFSPKNR